MPDDTPHLPVSLDREERAALAKFISSRPDALTDAEAARILIRDALIAMGDLSLKP